MGRPPNTEEQKAAQKAKHQEKDRVRVQAARASGLPDAQKDDVREKESTEQEDATKKAAQQETHRLRMQTARGLQTDAEKDHDREKNKKTKQNTRYKIDIMFIHTALLPIISI